MTLVLPPIFSSCTHISHCYMAPEMALGLGSDIKADVYSFGVVLWELASLQKPYEQFKMKKGICRSRLNYSFRPSVTSIPSPILQKLIQECWAFRSSDRPSFRKILQILKYIPNEGGSPPMQATIDLPMDGNQESEATTSGGNKSNDNEADTPLINVDNPLITSDQVDPQVGYLQSSSSTGSAADPPQDPEGFLRV